MSGNLLFNNAMKVVSQLKDEMAQLEAGSSHMSGQVHSVLQTLKRAADDIEDMAKREITTVKREKALGRAANVKAEYHHLKANYDRWKGAEAARVADQQRSELLGSTSGVTQRGGYSNGTPLLPSTQDPTLSKPMGDAPAILMMDGLLKEEQILNASGDRLDDFISISRTALQELYEQRTMLKSTQRRMLDVFNSLGLSTTVMRYIERRSQQDKWILFGGVIVSIFLMVMILQYLR